MSGHQLTKKPGSLSIHSTAMESTKHHKMLIKPTPEEETELIQSVSLSELEKKIRELINTNADIFPASSMEYTLNKARELEGKIADLIRATFRQINEAPSTFRARASNSKSTCENLVMELITENVDLLLSLGKDATGDTLTEALNKCRTKIKNLVSENVELLMLRLRDVEETLKEYTERVIKIKALRLAAAMLNNNNTNNNESSKAKATKEVKLNKDAKEAVTANGHGSSGSVLNVTAFKVPHLRPMSVNQEHVESNAPPPNERKQLLLKCFKNDGSKEKYRAYVYKMPSFKRTTISADVKRMPPGNIRHTKRISDDVNVKAETAE